MYCYKVNLRFLKRFTPSIVRSQCLSVPATQKYENSNENSELIKNHESIDLGIKFPPILDLKYPARIKRYREKWHNKVKKLTTIEEKIYELNMPRYYGWPVFVIKEHDIPYDPLPQTQYITQTHLISEPNLPAFYDNIIQPETLDALVQQIKSPVEEALVFEFNCRKRDYQYNSDELQNKALMDDVIAKAVSQVINRILINNLSPSYNHLIETQIDVDPRHEAFWFFGGHLPSSQIVGKRKQNWSMKDRLEEPVNTNYRYIGNPIFHVRHHLPLKEIISLKDSEDPNMEIPVQPLDPRLYEYFGDVSRATVIPGFWPGDHSQFGLISYHSRGHLLKRPENFNDNLDALKNQAILSSFSWLYSQACYQGFSTFQDPTYPFVNQSIITNGQWWSFSVYQLNTLAMHKDCLNENPRKNICWITEPMKLFDSIVGGKIEGLNEDVLKHLIKFYVNIPEVKQGVEMQPYLKGEKLIANIEDPERRKWIENGFKYLMSNRPRHRLPPEVYDWEKIYKIRFQTRPMDKKRQPFEFGINPYLRRLDEHTPQYIPKALREYPRSKKKWAKTYYPKVESDDQANS